MHAQSGTYVSGPACGSYNASSPSGRNTSAGFPCPWSGFDRWAIIPAAVHVHASRGVRFSNCSFRRLGATAVAFDKGSQNCSVASCLVEDVSGNGVQIGTIDSYNETVVAVPIEVLRLARMQFDYLSNAFARRGDVTSQAMSEIGGFAIDQALTATKADGG